MPSGNGSPVPLVVAMSMVAVVWCCETVRVCYESVLEEVEIKRKLSELVRRSDARRLRLRRWGRRIVAGKSTKRHCGRTSGRWNYYAMFTLVRIRLQ